MIHNFFDRLPLNTMPESMPYSFKACQVLNLKQVRPEEASVPNRDFEKRED